MKSWQVPVTSVGAVTTASMAWRTGGQLRVSVIVKATFSFVVNGAMRIAAPDDIIEADAHWNDDPKSSVYAPSDRAPYRPRVDFLFSGHAYAPANMPTQALSVRVAMARGNAKVFDKVITVVGDRSSIQSMPAPFTKMPIRYERAYGGPGFDANPVGVGQGPHGRVLPNLVYPEGWNKDLQPAALGPIAASWPARMSRRGELTPSSFDKTVVDLPASLDPSYFQSAPEDQRIAQVFGDEWILLENLHPAHPTLTMKLPDVRGAAMVFGTDGPDTPLALRIDTIFIDSDRESCVVTFRGSHPVANERALDGLKIAAGVEMAGAPIDWIDAKRAAMSGTSSAVGTTALDSNAPITFLTPFAIAAPATSKANASPSIPGAPFSAAMASTPASQIPVGYSTFAFAPPQPPAAVPAPPMPNPPSMPKSEEKPTWSWAVPEEKAQAKPIAPAAAAKPPPIRPASPTTAPAAKSALYGGFTPLKKP